MKNAGFENVIGTCSTEEKADFLRSIGATGKFMTETENSETSNFQPTQIKIDFFLESALKLILITNESEVPPNSQVKKFLASLFLIITICHKKLSNSAHKLETVFYELDFSLHEVMHLIIFTHFHGQAYATNF